MSGSVSQRTFPPTALRASRTCTFTPDSASLRYRAVLMTAWSFVIGVLPLVFADSAGAGAMRSIGICTMGGMLAATFVGIIFVPSLYALFQRMRERVSGWRARKGSAA